MTDDKPPPRDAPDDPLSRPASDAGWDDTPPPRGPSFPAYAPTAAPPAAPPPAAPPVTASPIAPRDEPLLPSASTYDENELRSAIGVAPLEADTKHRKRPETDAEEPDRPRNRTLIAGAALVLVGGLAIAGLVFLGRANSERYFLACETERAVPQQGRGFPPWGTRALDGEAWRPLKIAAETRCRPHETDDLVDLQCVYLAMLLDQATALLTAHDAPKLDEAEALLKQGLLLTRPPEQESEKLATERNEQRSTIERMLGDVTYGRASAKLRDAATALGEAAKQFDAAAEQHPLHAPNASGWAVFARRLADDVRGGPAGAPNTPAGANAIAPNPAPSSERAPAPPGVALPVESGMGRAVETAPAAPDAGVPTGGVLL